MARRPARLLFALTLSMGLALSGCSKPAEPEVQPKVAPPAIVAEGELAVGVDLSTPPFAGVDDSRTAGFDVDVASALAEQLGLTVRFVDVPPSDAATALAGGTVDVVMSVPLSDTSLSAISLAGSYASDGPAFFVSTGSTESVDPSITVDAIADVVGAQKGSAAFWYLRSELDESMVTSYDTLRAALEALDAGEVPLVAGDAFVGAYIIRDMPGLHYAGQVRPAEPLSVAVDAENQELADAVRDALDSLAADGVFDALRRKWMGDLPELAEPAAEEATSAP